MLTQGVAPVRRGADASVEAWRDGCGGRQDRGRGGRHWTATYNHLGRTRRPDDPHDPATTASWLRARPHHSATVVDEQPPSLAWANPSQVLHRRVSAGKSGKKESRRPASLVPVWMTIDLQIASQCSVMPWCATGTPVAPVAAPSGRVAGMSRCRRRPPRHRRRRQYFPPRQVPLAAWTQ